MKRRVPILVSAVAVLFVLGSCTKEPVVNGDADELTTLEGDRVITLAFGQSAAQTPPVKTIPAANPAVATKSHFGSDGLTPQFSNGDRIILSNGQSREVREIKVTGSTASVATALTGTLTAVYPSTAASLSGNTITGIKVPSNQSGRFADANIAMATIPEDAATATFEPKTAVLKFYVDESIGVKSITVTSRSGEIADGSNTITVDPAGNATLNTVTDDPQHRVCYVIIPEGTRASDLTFTTETTTQGSVTRAETSTTTFQAGHIFKAFVPYYIDLGDKGKWGYCNIGAFLPEEAGLYFSWGASGINGVAGQEPGATGAFSTSFSLANAKYYDGTSFTKYTGTDGDGLTVLEIPDDAATANWGALWRMPTQPECAGLASILLTWDSTRKGRTAGTAPNAVFLPACGYAYNSARSENGVTGYYWSSSLYPVSNAAYRLYFASGSVTPVNYTLREYGFPIRPIAADMGTVSFTFTGDKNIRRIEYTVRTANGNDYVMSGSHNYGSGAVGSAADIAVDVPVGTFNVELKVETDTPSDRNVALNESDWGGLYFKRIYNIAVQKDLNTHAHSMNTEDWSGVLMWYPDEGEEALYWSTKNLGATNGDSHTDWYGDWFPWAGCVPIYESVSWTGYTPNFVFRSEKPEPEKYSTWNITYKFDWVNTPYRTSGGNEGGGASVSKYNSDGRTRLEPIDDAAHCILGGDWRMATGGPSGEFGRLYAACGGTDATNGNPKVADIVVKTDYKSVPSLRGALLTSTETGKQLFLPAAGHCYTASGHNNNEVGGYARYLSSTLSPRTTAYNYHYLIYITGCNGADGAAPTGGSFWHNDMRSRNMSIRPVHTLP